MFCRQCGNKIEDNVKVCPKCGTEVIIAAPEEKKQDAAPASPAALEKKPRPVRHIDPAQRMQGFGRMQPNGPMQIKADPDAIPSVEPVKTAPEPKEEKPAEKPAETSAKKRPIRHLDPSERFQNYGRMQPNGPMQIKADPDAIPSVEPVHEKSPEKPAPKSDAPAPVKAEASAPKVEAPAPVKTEPVAKAEKPEEKPAPENKPAEAQKPVEIKKAEPVNTPVPEEKPAAKKNPDLDKLLDDASQMKPAASPFESLNQPKEKVEPKKNPDLHEMINNTDTSAPIVSPFESLNEPKEKVEPKKNPDLHEMINNTDTSAPIVSPFESLNEPKEKVEPKKNPDLHEMINNTDTSAPIVSPFESLNEPKEKVEPKKNPDLHEMINNTDTSAPIVSPFESLNEPKEKVEPKKNPELDEILSDENNLKPAASPLESLNQPKEKTEPVKTDKMDEIIDSIAPSAPHSAAATEKKSDAEIDDIIDNIKPSSPRPAPEPVSRTAPPRAVQPQIEDNPFRRTAPVPPPIPAAQASSASSKPAKKGGKKVGVIAGVAAGAVLIGGAGVGYFGFHNDITKMFMGDKEYARMIDGQAAESLMPFDGTADRYAGYLLTLISGAETKSNSPDLDVSELIGKTGALSGIFDTIPSGKSISYETKLKVKLGTLTSLSEDSIKKINDTLANTMIVGKLVNGDTDMISLGIKDAEGKTGSAEIYCNNGDVVVTFPGITEKTLSIPKDKLTHTNKVFDRTEYKRLCEEIAKIYYESFDGASFSFAKGTDQTHDFTCGKTELSAKASGSSVTVTFSAAQVETMFGKIKDLLSSDPYITEYISANPAISEKDWKKKLDSLIGNDTTLSVRHITDAHNNVFASCISLTRADGTNTAELKQTKQEGIEITTLAYDNGERNLSVGYAKKVRVGSDGNSYITFKTSEFGGLDLAFECDYTGSKTKEFLGTEVKVGKYIIKPADKDAIVNGFGSNSIISALTNGKEHAAELSKLSITFESTVTGSTHNVTFDVSLGDIGSYGFTVRADEGSESVSMPDTASSINISDSTTVDVLVENTAMWLFKKASEIDEGTGIISDFVKYDPDKRFIEHYSAYNENSVATAEKYAAAINADFADKISEFISASPDGASGVIKLYFRNGECEVIDPAGLEEITLDHPDYSSVYAEVLYDSAVSDTVAGVTVVLTDNAGDVPANLPDITEYAAGVYPWGSSSYIGFIGDFVVGTNPVLNDGEIPYIDYDDDDNDDDGDIEDVDDDTDDDIDDGDSNGDDDDDGSEPAPVVTPSVTTAATTKPVETPTDTTSDNSSSTDFGAVKKNPDISDVVGVWEGKSGGKTVSYAICSNYIMTPYTDGYLNNSDFTVLSSTKNGFDLYEKAKTKTGTLSYSAKTNSIKIEFTNGKDVILAKKKSGTKTSFMGNWTLYTYEGLTSSEYCKEYNDTPSGFAMNLSIGEFSAVITTSRKSEIYTIGKIKSGSCRISYNSWTYFDCTYDTGSGKLTLVQHYSDSSDTQEFVFVKGSYKF